ncbi:uracil-DNA glycosylase [Gracilibacillus oryzae]|uniref:Uracil-DNA glycosylase n=1 Tax=Gracilibacillus oryzae TaxID=1672701 RepID=A0A7C8KP59_9BACI|nr:uracil-DNA glycosylase [Gracilibacillus oryzae]KAB8129895.1 uracil-DNA glycosylase [Gracilibacillus oryzae]
MSKEVLKNDWANVLEQEFDKEYYKQLREFLKKEYQQYTIYPNMYDIFNALNYTSYADVKVVILGQDPYHGPDQAHGLSFSVKPEVDIPPSLRNIYKELAEDLGCSIPDHGYLKKWAEQGVLLLNNVLTVRAGQAHSHRGKGWEQFTNQVIVSLNDKTDPVVYILWGAAAQKKQALIDTSKHFIIKSPHPSPLSAHRGFFGSKPFSKTNEILQEVGKEPIDWQIE